LAFDLDRHAAEEVKGSKAATIAAIGSVYFAFSLSRFRRVIFGG
jgi:hypothetical protein